MSWVSNIRENYDGYCLDIKHSEESSEVISLFFNSRRNAETVKRVLEADEKEQTADFEEARHGEYTISDEFTEQYGYLYKCSCCGVLGWRGNFCSECGAKMKER